MTLINRWDPLRQAASRRAASDRLAGDQFLAPFQWMEPLGGPDMSVDMYETDNDLVVTTSLPGVRPEDVEITVTRDVLCMRAETKVENTDQKSSYFHQERRYGVCQRSVILPVEVQTDKAEAKFRDGVLTLTLPKSAAARPKTIKVTAEK